MAKFQKGRSGNPAGRPKGTGGAAKLRKAIEQELPEVIAAMITAAKAGDTAAAKLLLDRVCPTLKPEAGPVAIPGADTGSTAECIRAALEAVARGEVAPDAATTLIEAVTGLEDSEQAAQWRELLGNDCQAFSERHPASR